MVVEDQEAQIWVQFLLEQISEVSDENTLKLNSEMVLAPWTVKFSYYLLTSELERCVVGQVIDRSEGNHGAKRSCFFDNNLLIGKDENRNAEESTDDSLTTMAAEQGMVPSTTENPSQGEEKQMTTATQRSTSVISLTTTMSNLIDLSTRSEPSADKDKDPMPAEVGNVGMNIETEPVHQPGQEVDHELVESVDTAAADDLPPHHIHWLNDYPEKYDYDSHYDWETYNYQDWYDEW